MITKRILALFSIALLGVFMLSGCGNKQAADQRQDSAIQNQSQIVQDLDKEKEKPGSDLYEFGTPVTVDNVVFTITGCEINPAKGDRTEDNYADANGEYFAIGSDIVKAADYEQIEASITIENESDKAIHFSEVGWEAKLPDGYKLEQITVDGKIGEQIPSNYTAEGKVIIIKEKAIKAEQMELIYNFMDYNEEWQGAIWKAISGELTEKEYKDKFNPQPIAFKLKL